MQASVFFVGFFFVSFVVSPLYENLYSKNPLLSGNDV
jgi:hypothetical protein